jgi:hypothetical protein
MRTIWPFCGTDRGVDVRDLRARLPDVAAQPCSSMTDLTP